MNKIAIIGAGSAGLMCATTILESPNNSITIYESNNIIGKKLLLTGGGRCNLTTSINDIQKVIKNYPRGNKFLIPSLKSFTPKDTVEWFKNHGLDIKEENNKIYPKSDKSSDVVQVFKNILNNPKCELLLNTKVIGISIENNKFNIEFENKKEVFDILVLTTGGKSYPETGSTGDGYFWAIKLGHSVTQLGETLTALDIEDYELLKLKGISFEDASLTVKIQKNITVKGPLIITHNGISGPATFKLSSLIPFITLSKRNPLFVRLNPICSSSKHLVELLNKYKKENRNTLISKILSEYFPKRFVEFLLSKAEIEKTINFNNISKIEFNRLRNLVDYGIELKIIGRSRSGEFVTAGGISTQEINSKTMESKLVKNLYFAGEIIDYDGYTGGFNLQGAWSTGRLAGKSIINSL